MNETGPRWVVSTPGNHFVVAEKFMAQTASPAKKTCYGTAAL